MKIISPINLVQCSVTKKGGVDEKAVEISLMCLMLSSSWKSGKEMPPSSNWSEDVVVEAGWMEWFCQISFRRSVLTCLMWSFEGGAITA